MNHGHGHDREHHHHAAPGERPYFPAAEWEEFQKEDIKAGKAIILEMSAIFITGLLLYITVALIVAS